MVDGVQYCSLQKGFLSCCVIDNQQHNETTKSTKGQQQVAQTPPYFLLHFILPGRRSICVRRRCEDVKMKSSREGQVVKSTYTRTHVDQPQKMFDTTVAWFYSGRISARYGITFLQWVTSVI